MARYLLLTVRKESIRTFLSGKRELHIFGIVIRIQHAHTNQYQVLLPNNSEIFRIVDKGNRRLTVYTV